MYADINSPATQKIGCRQGIPVVRQFIAETIMLPIATQKPQRRCNDYKL